MKLLRFGAPGAEKPGLLASDGTIRDLSGIVSDFTPATLKEGAIAKVATADPMTLPIAPEGVRIGPIIDGVRNFIAVGLNYVDHAKETGAAIPSEPILFNKSPNCIIGPNDPVTIPKGSEKTDWEVELAIVIGKTASYVAAHDALDYVAGYAVCHDVSERSFQTERGGQWMKGKGCPTFGPLGPWLVTPDEIADIQDLDMFLDVNGTRAQTGNSKTMIFDCAQLVSYISHFLQLDPGDVITTGTPPGVGMGMKPPKFLRAGDKVKLGIAGLGEQEQSFVAYHA